MKSQLSKEEKTLAVLFTIYVYMTLLPSASVYVTTIPFLRHLTLFVVILLFGHLKQKRYDKQKYILIFAAIFMVVNLLSFVAVAQFISSDIGYLLQFITICIFVSLPLSVQGYIYILFVRIGAVLLFFGVIEYIGYEFLNKSYLLAVSIDRGEESPQVYDHGIFNIFTTDIIPRFQGLFREPGFLGICAGLLAFNWENLPKKDFTIWMIAGMFSLSLTFYVMVVMSIFYHVFLTKTSIRKRIIVALFAIVLTVFLSNLEIIQDAIVARVELYSSSEDNRTTGAFNDDLSKQLNSSDIFWGYGYAKFVNRGYTWGNGGIKAELYKHGLVLVTLFIIGFGIIVLSYNDRRKRKIFVFLIYLVAFYCVDCKYAIHEYIILLSMLNPYVKRFTHNTSTLVWSHKRI